MAVSDEKSVASVKIPLLTPAPSQQEPVVAATDQSILVDMQSLTTTPSALQPDSNTSTPSDISTAPPALEPNTPAPLDISTAPPALEDANTPASSLPALELVLI